MKRAQKIIKTNRAPSAAMLYIYNGFGDTLDPYMPLRVGKNTEVARMHTVHKLCMKGNRVFYIFERHSTWTDSTTWTYFSMLR